MVVTTMRPDIIRRPRLESRLDEAFGKRLTTIVAGAGYGKSTLVSGWASDTKCAWHAVQPEDALLSPLHTRLRRALTDVVPALSGRLGTLATVAAREEALESMRAEALAASVADALAEHLEHDLVLVVDDAHLVPPGGASARFLEMLIRQAPETLHLMLLSRREPPFPIDRMRRYEQVLELVADDLTFQENEVESLAHAALGVEGGVLAAGLVDVTEGWPVAVRMAVERLRDIDADEWPHALDAMRLPGGELFGFLAEEVFGNEPDEVRELLRVAAEFPRVTSSLVEAIGLGDAHPLLAALARRGLLLDAMGDGGGWYRLHDLVRAFCLEEWPRPKEERGAFHLRAAAWFAEHAMASDALRSLRVAGDPVAVAAFLRDHGRPALPEAARELIELAEELPSALQDADVALCLGEAHVAAGNLAEGRQQLVKAAGDATELDPRLVRLIAVTYYSDGDLNEAVEIFPRARVEGADPREVALMLALWSNFESLRGNGERARELAQEALAVATKTAEAQARAHAYHALGLAAQLAGDGGSFLEYYRQAAQWADRAEDSVLAGRTRTNLVAELIADGRVTEALDDLARVIDDAELSGASADRLPMVLTVRGNALSALGRYDEAIASYESVTRLLEQRGEQFGAGHLVGLGDTYRERGDVALARAAYERCIALADPLHNVVHLPPALSGLARLRVAENPDEAEQLAERSLAESTGMFDVSTRLGYGWVALALGDRDRALALAQESEILARSRSHRSELAESLELRAIASEDGAARELLEDVVGVWRELGNDVRRARAELALARRHEIPDADALARRAEKRLRSAGVRIEAAARAAGLLAWLPPARTPLRVETLGGFRLVREGREVATAEWRSKKARDLLKVVVSRRGRPTPREAIMEALWPGEDPAALSNRLSVALSTVRSVLDPERQLASDHYLRADLHSVSLANLPIDVESFLAEAAAGLAGDEERLEDAEALYAGDFLEDDAYDDWAIPLREEVRATYIEVAYALAEQALGRGDLDGTARLLRRILERDPFDERAHLELVAGLVAAGQHGQARRAYRGYTARMDEIAVEPAPFPQPARPV